MSLHLTLFGSPVATDAVHGIPCHLQSNKAIALLAYLAIESGKPLSRLTVASLLWSDVSEEKALRSLRQTLHQLRQSLKSQIGAEAADFIVSNRLTVQGLANEQGEGWWSDAPAFSSLIAATRRHTHSDSHSCPTCLEKLAAAVALYQGELMAGFQLTGAELYEEWLSDARRAYRLQVLQALHDLLEGQFQLGDYVRVADHARRMIQLEPWQETGWRYLILALAAGGNRQLALTEYEACRRLFADELALTPSPELTALHQQIQAEVVLPTPSGINPYRGLQTFTEVDAEFFFGREETVEQLSDRLRKSGFVAVVAPSGGGKSSVVNAGLLPHLRQEGWQIRTIRPGDQPLDHLVEALDGLGQGSAGSGLLVVDQFEELFASIVSSSERQRFLDVLLAARARQRHASFAVVITLRADFIGNAIGYRCLADALQNDTLLLGPMNHEELRRVITEPAKTQGVSFESGLVERLARDVGTEAGQLPLLQFMLHQLWENRTDSQLTHIAYESIGRLEGALTQYADQVYGQLSADEQKEAKTICLRMVQPDQHVADMRRPLSRSSVTETQWSVVRKLADDRLFVTGMDSEGIGIAELVHEVILRYWHRFQMWLAEDRGFRDWVARLEILTRQWEATGKDEGGLLRGAPLFEAEKWLTERTDDLLAPARTFIEASLQLREHQAELESRRQAREQSHTFALAAQLALLNNNPGEALDLAFTANQIDEPPIGSQRILSEAAYAPGTRRVFQHSSAAVLDIALHPDDEHFLAGSADGTVSLWHRTRSEPLSHFTNHRGAVYCVAFSPDGETAVSGDGMGNLRWWHVTTGQTLTAIDGASATKGAIRSVVVLPDGSGFLAAGDDHIVRLWMLPDGRLAHEFAGHRDTVHCLAVSDDGRWAASGGADHDLILWDLNRRELARNLAGHANVLPLEPNPSGHFSTIFGVTFTPDARYVFSSDDSGRVFQWEISGAIVQRYRVNTSLRQIDVTDEGGWALLGSIEGQVIVLNLDTGEVVRHLRGHRGRTETVAFVDGGRSALSASTDGEIRLWDLRYGAEERYLQYSYEHEGGLISFDISPDGQVGVFGFLTGDMASWSVSTGTFLRRWSGHEDMVAGGCRFSADGRLAVSGSGDFFGDPLDKSVRVWEVETGTEVHCFRGHTSHIRAVAFAPDQKFVLSAGLEGELRYWSLVGESHHVLWNVAPQGILSIAISPDSRWAVVGLGKGKHLSPDTALYLFDLKTRQRVRCFTGHSEGVMGLAFAPDSSFFLSGGFDNSVRMWDVSTGKCRQILLGHQGAPTSVAISPSGRFGVSGGYEATIILWDLEKGNALRRWQGHTGMITKLNFTPDGKSVISISLDNSVRQWRVDATQEALLGWIRENRQIPRLEDSNALSPSHPTASTLS